MNASWLLGQWALVHRRVVVLGLEDSGERAANAVHRFRGQSLQGQQDRNRTALLFDPEQRCSARGFHDFVAQLRAGLAPGA